VVVILNWNGLADTLECLLSVRRQGYPDLEVVVIDNGSRPPEPEQLRRQAVGAYVILSPINIGFAGGCNIGMRHALTHAADYVWLLNNDSVVGPGCLAELVAAGEADDRVGLLSPVVCDYDSPHQIRFAGTVVDFRRQDRIHLTSVEEMLGRDDADRLALTGTALLVKRGVMERTGLFDERYFAYVEDTDYSTRALRDGFTTRVVPAAVLYHKEGRSLGGLQSPVREFLLVRNWYLFWSTHLVGWRRWGFRRRYVSWVLDRALAARLMPEVADESLNGGWDALSGHWGSWEQRRPMPSRFKVFLQRWVLGWHPYFWIRLLAGDLRGLSGEATRRVFKRRAQPR
jgi:GT2 family glycosyltransferase